MKIFLHYFSFFFNIYTFKRKIYEKNASNMLMENYRTHRKINSMHEFCFEYLWLYSISFMRENFL